jgi:hypothetical protein
MVPWKGLCGPACGQARFLKVGVSVSRERWDWSTANPRPARKAAPPERRHERFRRERYGRHWGSRRWNRLLGRYLGDHLIGGSFAYRRFGGFGLPGGALAGARFAEALLADFFAGCRVSRSTQQPRPCQRRRRCPSPFEMNHITWLASQELTYFVRTGPIQPVRSPTASPTDRSSRICDSFWNRLFGFSDPQTCSPRTVENRCPSLRARSLIPDAIRCFRCSILKTSSA